MSKSLWNSSGGTVHFASTGITASTTELTDRYGTAVQSRFNNAYSIQLIASILLELVLSAKEEWLRPSDVCEHIEATLEKLNLTDESRIRALWEMKEVLFDFYEIFRQQVYPLIKDKPEALQTIAMRKADYRTVEFGFFVSKLLPAYPP